VDKTVIEYYNNFYRFVKSGGEWSWTLCYDAPPAGLLNCPHVVIDSTLIDQVKSWILYRYNVIESDIYVIDSLTSAYGNSVNKIVLVFNSDEDEAVFMMGKN